MGKKSKTIEAISKVIYDPNLDPQEFDVIFLDSGKYRRVPFTFLTFTEKGFRYDASFLPGYKIRAVVNRKTGAFLVNRGYTEADLIEHKWPTIPDFPIKLTEYFDRLELSRYTAYILRKVEEKLQDPSADAKPSFYFGETTLHHYNDKRVEVVQEEGPFLNLIVLNQKKLLRGFPTPLHLKLAKEHFPEYERVGVYPAGSIRSIFQVGGKVIAVSDGNLYPSPNLSMDCSQLEVIHQLATKEGPKRLALSDSTTHHIHPIPSDQLLLAQERLSSVGWRNKDVMYFLHDFDTLPVKREET